MLIFTLSYIKNLPNAFVLGDSLKEFHPEISFQIGLVDDITKIPKDLQSPYPIVSVNELAIPNFEDLQSKYNENELLPNCKPFFFEYFLKTSETVVFIENGSKIYDNLGFLEKEFNENEILIVPQLLLANAHPKENNALNTGVIHSGFIGVKNTENTKKFVNWWQNHTSKNGFIDFCKGMNTDQYCLELVPTLFDKVKILKYIGLNIGEWNFAERKLSTINGKNFVNNAPVLTMKYQEGQFSKDYLNDLKKYDSKRLAKIKISYGIPVKKIGVVAKSIILISKSINKLIDRFFDIF